MGSLLRSEDMTKLQIVFDEVAAHDTVDELGKTGMFEFEDQNEDISDFQRHFAPNIRRCEELQRRLRFLAEEMKKLDLEPDDDYTQVPEDGLRFDNLESLLEKLEANIQSLNINCSQLEDNHNTLVEQKIVLEKGAEFFKNAPIVTKSSYGATDDIVSLSSTMEALGAQKTLSFRQSGKSGEELLLNQQSVSVGTPDLLNTTMGLLAKSKVLAFNRLLFRASRGNALSRYTEVDEPILDTETGEKVEKVVFIIFHFGEEMASKVSKICKAFMASVLPFPEKAEDQRKMYARVTTEITDLKGVIDSTKRQRRELLADLIPKFASWDDYVMREKSIYHSLNMVKTEQKVFVATGWVPTIAIDSVRTAAEKGKKRSHSQAQTMIETQHVPASAEPPTYFRTNRFTSVFQGIVESYAVAQYKEMNPAPFAVVSFPFLFAVMFGDIGHGIIMAAVAFLIIRAENSLKGKKLDEMTATLYDGRYIIFMMGCFSIFTGLIYNEFFAVPLDIFGGRWKYTDASAMACGIDNCDDPAAVHPPLAPYPFGFDPIWKGSTTGLLFFNSYKMKLSIILGVAQMVLGICLSYRNARFFKEPIDVWYVFVPQMVFMNSIFGYLCLLIILKWCINYDAPECRADPNCVPPDIKAILIGMFMSPGSLEPKLQMYPGQALVQALLLAAALISVPVMFLAKPLLLKQRHENRQKNSEHSALLGEEEDDEAGHGHGEFVFGDVMVQNMIHTIEFVLGCVSNTASYLRLWALSLAHAELSDVFLEKLIYMGAESGSAILMVVCYSMWIAMTIGVLMLMESLSAFLHALRLHWVEFQNKFYSLHGPGAKFRPFSYEELRKGEE
uniref:V-type proton ATPase subunit a n=2 Tax=Rhodosorus marinus TaxID=101924 RepID=A0A7S3E923_9RHOD|mmetsp:Transcript_18638/g.74925  ORF Transcript_18638/g.74925 Transcript_18638/m.74925 type:complete len:842 (+) Transcript_18638:238-2763(+)